MSWNSVDNMERESIISEQRQKVRKIFTMSSFCFFTIRNTEINEKKKVRYVEKVIIDSALLLATNIDKPDTIIKPRYNKIIFFFLNKLYKSEIEYFKIKYENDIKFNTDKTNNCGTTLS